MKMRLFSMLMCVCFMLIGLAQTVSATSVPPSQPPAPTSPALDFVNEILTGVTTEMQYRINATNWRTIATGTTLDISRRIPTANVRNDATLRIRYRATTQTSASDELHITLPRRPATPVAADVRFDGFTDTIIVDRQLEYSVGRTGSFTSISPGTTLHINVGSTSQNYQFRVPAVQGTSFASAARSITVPARRAAPRGVAYNGSRDLITGVSVTMQYSLDGGSSWANVTGTTIPRSALGDGATTVLIRTRASSARPASSQTSIDVPSAATPSSAPAPGSPNGLFLNILNETIENVSTLMEYSTNGSRWRSISTGTSLPISSLIRSAASRNDTTLYIRYKAAGGAAASVPTIIVLPRRPAAPTAAAAAFDMFSESIAINTVLDIEFRTGRSGNFTPAPAGGIPVNLGSSSPPYQVRFRATSDSFASAVRTINVPSRGAAPTTALYNSSSAAITGVTTAMEYSVDNSSWIRVTGTTIPRAELGAGTVTVRLRFAATSTRPASQFRTITVQ